MEDFVQARIALDEARRRYADAGRRVTHGMAARGVPLRDAATILNRSLWAVSRLQAEEPQHSQLVHWHGGAGCAWPAAQALRPAAAAMAAMSDVFKWSCA